MKLTRLKLNSDFNSLHEGFELNFRNINNETINEEFAPFVLAGRNGSGKSNVLEVLAAIFFNLDLRHLDFIPKKLGWKEYKEKDGAKSNSFEEIEVLNAESSIPESYELEYIIPVIKEGKELLLEVAIKKLTKELPIVDSIKEINSKSGETSLTLQKFGLKEILPEYIVGYSSGENQVLSLPFLKSRFIQYDEYLDNLINAKGYNGKPESRLSYLDNEFSQAILLSNMLMQQASNIESFKKEVKIEALTQFQIIIQQHHREDYSDEYLIALNLNTGSPEDTRTIPLLAELQTRKRDGKAIKLGVIDKLKSCSTCHFYDNETESLYLDYYVNSETLKAFSFHFDDAIDLFQNFQVLLNLNLYGVSKKLKTELYESDSLYVNETLPIIASDERIMRFKDLTLKKEGIEKPIYLKNLSDGEHQFLHTLGLCLLYKDKNCLFLMDEPETHFNPDWRAKFISSLQNCFKHTTIVSEMEIGKSLQPTQREMLITTHSPFLISDSEEDKVLVFDKENDKVIVTNPEYTTLGSSINKITLKTFKTKATIGGVATKKMTEFKGEFSSTVTHKEKQDLIDRVNYKLGDSVEKLLFIKDILDSMDDLEKVSD
jgi:restriction system-associated AAA family ATPase